MAKAGMFIEDLKVGQTGEFSKTVTERDIELYAEVSGDTNPVHLDEAYAKTTMFKGRIAHGMLSAGFISAVFGTVMPGPGTIYMGQSLRFKAPVKIGDTVTAKCTVTEIDLVKKRVKFDTQCLVAGKPVIEGDALLMVPSRAG
jgi:3-hydroxybutyryl-CoA dehydratase